MPPNNAWRSPAVQLTVNGTPITGVLDVEVVSTNYFSADRFRARIAIGSDSSGTAAFWSATGTALVGVEFSLGDGSFQSIIQGLVDCVTLDTARGLIRIEGRDLTAPLIETRATDSFANRTSSEIATIIAQRHDLTAAVTPTTTPVGRYYQDEHDRVTPGLFSRAISEWDQLVFLARQEGFNVFVQGTALVFQPAQPQASPFTLQPQDTQSLTLERSLSFAKDLRVTVKSWNSRLKTAVSQTASASDVTQAGGSPSFDPQIQSYTIVQPNLTPDEALQLAQQRVAELIRHERVVEAVFPGELTLTPRSQILLAGTGTEFDQIYFVDLVERSLDPRGGFRQRVRATNSSPRAIGLASPIS